MAGSSLAGEIDREYRLKNYYKNKANKKLKRLKERLPEKCQECGLLEIVNLDKEKVRCFYNINNKCILE